jgi:hypothetical protein
MKEGAQVTCYSRLEKIEIAGALLFLLSAHQSKSYTLARPLIEDEPVRPRARDESQKG